MVAQSVELTMKGLFPPLYVTETEANNLFSVCPQYLIGGVVTAFEQQLRSNTLKTT